MRPKLFHLVDLQTVVLTQFMVHMLVEAHTQTFQSKPKSQTGPTVAKHTLCQVEVEI